MNIAGLDLSKVHYGMCFLKNDNSIDYTFTCSSKTLIKKAKDDGFLCHYIESYDWYKKNISNNPHSYTAYLAKKMYWFINRDIIHNLIGKMDKSVCIEGYAYGASGQLTQIAEITGVIKKLLTDINCKIRIHDAKSIKMWATGNGNADKDAMLKAACKFISIPDYIKKHTIAYDIADSYFLMDILRKELQVREKPSLLDTLSLKKKQIFNRVTKANPVNLLDRDWIERENKC